MFRACRKNNFKELYLLEHRAGFLVSNEITLNPSLRPILRDSFGSVIAEIVKANDHHVLHWRPNIWPVPLFTCKEVY
jgi:hypothetical protein